MGVLCLQGDGRQLNHRESFMTAMNETPGEQKMDDLGDDVDNHADESLDAADKKAPDSAPSQPATIAPDANRSANIGH
jgi:hypothetical protein